MAKPIELYEGGTFLVNGLLTQPQDTQAVRDASPTQEVQTAKQGTMTYRILHKHNHCNDGNRLKIKFDMLTSHDITYVGIIQTAKASGLVKFPIPY
ncbi:MAG: hydratase, partial [Clostridium sp.]|nr:hydratase [Clostridium sp.]